MKTNRQSLSLGKMIFLFLILGGAWAAFAGVSPEPDRRQSNESLKLDEPVEFKDSLPSEEPEAAKDAPPSDESFPDELHHPVEKSPLETSLNERYPLFDDEMLLEGYAQKYKEESKDTLLAMIKDDTLNPYKTAAAVRVFREYFASEVFSKEKNAIEKILLRRFNRTDSPFVEVEIMHILCIMDRYKYFSSMVPILIQRLDHYNETVNELAYNSLKNIIDMGNNRTREARIVFNTLRKNLFITRRNLATVKEPSPRLKQKLDLLRWSIKVLGSSELKRLPKEVINLF